MLPICQWELTMKRLFLGVLVSCSLIASAEAQQAISKYDFDTIDSSIKCELSRVAKLYGPQRGGGPVMKVSLELTGTETVTKKIAVGFFGKASYETSRKDIEGAAWTRNIHEKNGINCSKSFVVDLGLYECMQRQQIRFSEGRTVFCGRSTYASAQAGVGVTFVWFIETKIEGDLVIRRDYEWKLKAPPPRGA